MTGDVLFGNSGLTKRGIQGRNADNDFWFVGGGGTASNSGFMEIATGDDGQTTGTSEPIYISQYGPGTPLTGSLVRRGALLDASGNTNFPGTVTAPSFVGDGSALTGTGKILQVVQDLTRATTKATSHAGFSALNVTLSALSSTSSRVLVQANVYGSAGDDAYAFLEYRINGGAWQKNTNLNAEHSGYYAAMGDFSITRDQEDKLQINMTTNTMFSPNTTGTVEVRVICTCENTAGFWLNRGRTEQASYNGQWTLSTLTLWEVA
jgi:hypothetical protein